MKIHLYKKFTLAVIIAGMAFVLSPNLAISAEKSGLSSNDKSFVTDATEGGNAEIKMGELGKEKATSPEIKSLAEMLVTDHTKANAALAKIVMANGGEVPKGTSTMQKADYMLLKAKSGESFDKAFADQSVKDHQATIALFEKASNEVDNPELKAFAKKTLPTLKEHLSMSERAAASLTKKESK